MWNKAHFFMLNFSPAVIIRCRTSPQVFKVFVKSTAHYYNVTEVHQASFLMQFLEYGFHKQLECGRSITEFRGHNFKLPQAAIRTEWGFLLVLVCNLQLPVIPALWIQ